MAIRKIMLVDDSPAQLNEMLNAVSRVDATVVTATNGKDAVALAKAEKPDIIFMDIVMDELDGYGACRNLKDDAETRDIPVIFVTTKNQRADLIWADKLGAEAVINKPFQAEELLEQINRHN